jgi:hypothetical protein
MALKVESEVSIAIATGVLAYAAYQMALPNLADIRSLEKGNADIQGAERAAAWTAAGMVSLVALLTKSPSVFTVGGAVVIGSSWATRHADTVDTVTKRAAAFAPAPAMGATEGPVGDQVVGSQNAPVLPLYGVAV